MLSTTISTLRFEELISLCLRVVTWITWSLRATLANNVHLGHHTHYGFVACRAAHILAQTGLSGLVPQCPDSPESQLSVTTAARLPSHTKAVSATPYSHARDSGDRLHHLCPLCPLLFLEDHLGESKQCQWHIPCHCAVKQ